MAGKESVSVSSLRHTDVGSLHRFAGGKVAPGVVHENLEGWIPAMASDLEIRTALEKAFPTGVCDFSKPGVGQQPTIPWQTYQNDSEGGAVAYGGKALGAAPAGSGEGWTSPAFAGWLK